MDDVSDEEREVKSHPRLPPELSDKLEKLPEEFKNVPFNPMPSIFKILQSSNKEQKLDEIESYFEGVDAAMNLIVDGKMPRMHSLLLQYMCTFVRYILHAPPFYLYCTCVQFILHRTPPVTHAQLSF
jgi:hypothetical protein